jgi:hypothetical protein
MKVVGVHLLLIRVALVGFADAAVDGAEARAGFLVYLDEFSAYVSDEAKTIHSRRCETRPRIGPSRARRSGAGQWCHREG